MKLIKEPHCCGGATYLKTPLQRSASNRPDTWRGFFLKLFCMKYLLTALLCFALSFTATAQTTFTTTKVVLKEYNSFTSKWEEIRTTYPTIEIMFYGNMIMVKDEAKSNYRLTTKRELSDPDFTGIEWEGTDEKDRNVFISFVKYKSNNAIVLFIFYDKMNFIYHLK